MQYEGLLYRALNPVYARTPYSGRGAALYGGRFNPKGQAALYTSLSPSTAIRESNQVGTLQPTTLVAYQASLDPVFDGRDPAQLAAYGLTLPDMATDAWRDLAREPGGAPTQCLATALIAAGYVGLLVPSFARGASPKDSNLVLWKWGNTPVARLRLIDDQNRLGNQAPPAP